MPSRTGLQDVPSSIYWTASIGPFPEISKAFLPDDRKSNSDFPRSSEIEKANLTSHPRGGAPSNPTWNGTRTVPYTLPDEVPLPIMWSVRPRALGFHSGVFSRAFPSDMVPVADLRPPPLAICRQRVKPIVSGSIARPSSKLQHRRKITDKKQRQASLPQRLHSQRLHSEQLHPERIHSGTSGQQTTDTKTFVQVSSIPPYHSKLRESEIELVTTSRPLSSSKSKVIRDKTTILQAKPRNSRRTPSTYLERRSICLETWSTLTALPSASNPDSWIHHLGRLPAALSLGLVVSNSRRTRSLGARR